MTKLVTVLMATYNAETFISDTIDSILNQTYSNLQIIIIDDASTDSTLEILKCYAQNDSRIEIIDKTQNENICCAINDALPRIKGEYIASIGHDDIWYMEKIEKQIEYMERNPNCGVCFSFCDIINDLGDIWPEDGDKAELYKLFNVENRSRVEWQRQLLYKNNVFCAPSSVIRKECICNRSRIYDYTYIQLQDYALWLDILKSWNIYIMPEKLVHYRQFENRENLSFMSIPKLNREIHEKNIIVYNYVLGLDENQFFEVFSDKIDVEGLTCKNLVCAKAMILKAMNNPYALLEITKVLDDDKLRKLLEENFEFSLNDFYDFNKKPLEYNAEDLSNYIVIEQLKNQISQYQIIVQKYEEIIKMLQAETRT